MNKKLKDVGLMSAVMGLALFLLPAAMVCGVIMDTLRKFKKKKGL